MELFARARINGATHHHGNITMKKMIAAALVAAGIALVPMTASAGERVNDAVAGGLSGALVAGPVGLVAGGLIGYTAGPHIGDAITPRHRYRGHRHHVRHVRH
jgi:hypothetical protein